MNSPFVDWQQVAALSIVAVAAFFVLKRLWGQMMAFRSRPARRKLPSATLAKTPPTRPQPLVQIQLTPPRHMKRPPSNN